jgi:phosphopantetheinyl transferase
VKEAVAKALGAGLRLDLHAIQVHFNGGTHVDATGEAKAKLAELNAQALETEAVSFAPGYVAAVALLRLG